MLARDGHVFIAPNPPQSERKVVIPYSDLNSFMLPESLAYVISVSVGVLNL